MGEVGTNRRNVLRVLRTGTLVSALSVPITLIIIPFILRSVSLEGFGEWTTISAVLSVAALAEIGIPTEVARRVAAGEAQSDFTAARRAVGEAIQGYEAPT